MSRIVRCSLIQASNAASPDASMEATKRDMIDKHVALIGQAADAGAQIVCLPRQFFRDRRPEMYESLVKA